jgi:shikimate kinase
MATVVLVGFSCAGKSTILRRAKDEWPEVICWDTDEQLALDHLGTDGRPHIFQMFVDLGRARALQKVDGLERDFLDRQNETTAPTLIAAGPFIPTRQPSFNNFVRRVRPSFIYLSQTPELVVAGLRARRERHVAELAGLPNVGPWDEDIQTKREGDEWVTLSDSLIRRNVNRSLSGVVATYQRLAGASGNVFDVATVRSGGGERVVLERIAELLGLPNRK